MWDQEFFQQFFSLTYVICYIVFYILLVVGYWRIFTKAGEAGWKSIIPILNIYVIFKIAWGNGWLFLLLLIPIVNVVILFITDYKLCQAFGKGIGFFIGMIFLPNIFWIILGFDKSTYIGPNGQPQAI